ncbi:hypothetical protein KEM48_012483 [Puccinia striiformis f. sp. tritici PST-130]|nr:hypothetical protein KEM48_012483 [Puccinia striiformis f. sp. tritici PST-130]
MDPECLGRKAGVATHPSHSVEWNVVVRQVLAFRPVPTSRPSQKTYHDSCLAERRLNGASHTRSIVGCSFLVAQRDAERVRSSTRFAKQLSRRVLLLQQSQRIVDLQSPAARRLQPRPSRESAMRYSSGKILATNRAYPNLKNLVCGS